MTCYLSPGLEIEMMKERLSKLLLGEDMSGCGNGVCTALAISNAITNLCGTLHRLCCYIVNPYFLTVTMKFWSLLIVCAIT